jgi:hypothetical protein
LRRLAGYLERGLSAVVEDLKEVRERVKVVAEVAACLEGLSEQREARQAQYGELLERLRGREGEFAEKAASMMADWEEGLFAGSVEGLPVDNLELERWFKLPKRHLRHIHGRAHAGVRLVQEGATLLPTLNAHEQHQGPFTAEELLDYRNVPLPSCQRQAFHRRKIMRKARSAKQRPILLAQLEQTYLNAT